MMSCGDACASAYSSVRLSLTPNQQMRITIASFITCLANWTSVCGEKKMRFKPASGLSLLNFGASSCGENRRPNCSTLATTASTTAERNAIASSGVYGITAAMNMPPTERIVSSSREPACCSATVNACAPAPTAPMKPACSAMTIARKIAEPPMSWERGPARAREPRAFVSGLPFRWRRGVPSATAPGSAAAWARSAGPSRAARCRAGATTCRPAPGTPRPAAAARRPASPGRS